MAKNKNLSSVKTIGANKKKQIISILEDSYKGLEGALEFGSVFQLLVAVILSAQTNDNQVNKITRELFPLYPEPKDIAALTPEELEQYIRTCGLYKNKAKNILAATKAIIEEFNGEVPQTREELMTLPGVGRKTANVVLSVGYNKPALAVDTHVFRVSRRLGLALSATPDKVEEELCALIPENKWAKAHHWLIWHGRKICQAQKPKCSLCPLKELCPSLQGELIEVE